MALPGIRGESGCLRRGAIKFICWAIDCAGDCRYPVLVTTEAVRTGKREMRTVLFVCWLALSVGALLCGIHTARAQGVDVRQACTPDAMRLCNDFIPDVAKITACMNAKHRLLSVECRTAMAASHREQYRHVRRYAVRHERRERHVRHERHHS
jgi:hypothetical protein